MEAEGNIFSAFTEEPSKWNTIDLPRLLVQDKGTWRDRGACTGHTEWTQYFFGEVPDLAHLPRKGGRLRESLIGKAQAICAGCEVRKECFRFAKNNKIGHGVWGGIDFFMSSLDIRNNRQLPDDVD